MPASLSSGDYKPSVDHTRDTTAPTAAPRGGCCRGDNNGPSGTAFPRDAPHRSLYIGLRATGVLVGMTLIVLSAVSLRVANLPGRWLSVSLSPGINSMLLNAFDLLSIYRTSHRHSPLLRLFWDGGAAAGIFIAGGFLTSWTVHLANSGSEMVVGGVDRLVLSAVMVAGLFTASLIHMAISVSGFRSWRQLRAARDTSTV
ncbi:hypothetical protein RB595_007788 [Gaeumannomyces hyphopodioides]